MANIIAVKGDQNYYLNFTVTQTSCTNPNLQLPVDISNATILFKVAAPTTPKTLIVDGECEIVNGPNGLCRYRVLSTDFTKVGTFMGELQITTAGDGYGEKILTARGINISVVTDLG